MIRRNRSPTGWLVYYNFFRPHMSLNDRTPASIAGIMFPFRNWKDICEQPYGKRARIPIKAYVLTPEDTLLPEVIRRDTKHKKTLKRKTRNREKPVTSIAGMRAK